MLSTEKYSNLTLESFCSDNIEILSPDLYQEKKDTSLYFVMERLNNFNFDFWHQIYKKKRKWVNKQFLDSQDQKSQHVVAGLMGFRDSLLSFCIKQSGSPHEVWILYASIQPIKTLETRRSENIEMMCTVSTAANCPFTTHMGITRLQNNHPNISMSLHSFGAKVTKLKWPEKIYMMTTPMSVMRDIFKKALREQHLWMEYNESYYTSVQTCRNNIAQLESKEKALQKQLEQNRDDVESKSQLEKVDGEKEYEKEKLKFFQEAIASSGAPPLLLIQGKSSFHLKDPAGNSILVLDENQMYKEYAWFFERDCTFSSVNRVTAISLDALASYSK